MSWVAYRAVLFAAVEHVLENANEWCCPNAQSNEEQHVIFKIVLGGCSIWSINVQAWESVNDGSKQFSSCTCSCSLWFFLDWLRHQRYVLTTCLIWENIDQLLYITPTGEALCSIVVSQKSSNKICLKTELETTTIPSLTSRLTCWIPDCSFVERMGGESMQLFANGADPSNWKRGLSSEMCTLELKLFLHWDQSHFELACAYDLQMPVMFLRE